MPTISGTASGEPTSLSLTTLLQSIWLDAGSHVSVPSIITPSQAGERWITSSETTTVTLGASLSPQYIDQYLLIVNTSPIGLSTAPTISPSSSSGWYNSGSTITLTANTVSGYAFILWQIDGTNRTVLSNTTQVIMNEPHSAIAIYEQPTGAIGSLISTVNYMNLQPGTQASLDAKLSAALSSLNSGDSKTAVNQLNAFINEVNAQSERHIPTSDAQLLFSYAQEVIGSIES